MRRALRKPGKTTTLTVNRHISLALAAALIACSVPIIHGTGLRTASAAGTKAQDAQALIFDAPYLEPLKAPGKLIYNFDYVTADGEVYGESFSDTISLTMMPGNGGGSAKNVTFELFTGERQRKIGPVVNAKANSAVMMFLEWDLSRMKRYIKGEPAYFRNRVRQAFRESAEISEIKFTYNGKEMTGTRLTIRPYTGDPNAAGMQIFHAKVYEFIVSDDIPGGIYQIRIMVPNTAVPGPAKYFIDEKMTFARYEPGGVKP